MKLQTVALCTSDLFPAHLGGAVGPIGGVKAVVATAAVGVVAIWDAVGPIEGGVIGGTVATIVGGRGRGGIGCSCASCDRIVGD